MNTGSDSASTGEGRAPDVQTGGGDAATPVSNTAHGAILIDEPASPLNPSDRAFWIGLVVVGLSVVAALASYLILTGLTSIVPRNEVVWIALAINTLLILAMLAIIVWQAMGLRKSWKRRVPGARLHIRIVLLFSLIAALPAVLLAVAATTTFSRSLDGWFSTRTRAIIENSYDVAKAYVEEHGQVIRNDVANMVRDIDGTVEALRGQPDALQNLLIGQAGLRDITAAAIVDRDGVPSVMALDDAKIAFVVPSPAVIAQAERGMIPVLMPGEGDRITAIAKLNKLPGKYLYVVRAVSGKVLGHLRRTERNVDEYARLRSVKGGLRFAHGLIYFMISMTGLLAAIWAGMWFAGRFVAPIRRIIAGAQEVAKGNLDIALPEKRGEGDLRRLSENFNQMTREIKLQQSALVSTNAQLTERRNFIEAVLSGVTAGVVGLDSADRITLMNRGAESLLGLSGADAIGRPFADVVPEFADVLTFDEEFLLKSKGQHEFKKLVGDDERTFAVRITRERGGEGDVGSVVTFDDVSELVQAQRTSAWADVARRIAHEIKNPLTPIQLSAERLRKRFASKAGDQQELFETLTQTIERQTGHIKSMVDEFASFARMPQPVMAEQDLRLAVHESAVLFREGDNKAINFKLELPDTKVVMRYDLRLMTQAVTNLIKNATEAIEGLRDSGESPEAYQGEIEVRMSETDDRVTIQVIDNGIGLPKQNRSRLLEPYMTTRAKGTGLGLAIVQKIVEQHSGTLTLEDAPVTSTRTRGACVRLVLPKRSSETTRSEGKNEQSRTGDTNRVAADAARAAE